MKPILIFPKRGQPPEVPSGYERMPGDPYTLRLALVTCGYRSERTVKVGCCERPALWCRHFQKETSRYQCKLCEVPHDHVRLIEE